MVVETARHVLDYTGGVLIMPMTVLVEQYWNEISSGIADSWLHDSAEVVDTSNRDPRSVARIIADAVS